MRRLHKESHLVKRIGWLRAATAAYQSRFMSTQAKARLIATTWTDCVLEAFSVAYAFGMREHL